jgi:hypothetical protein
MQIADCHIRSHLKDEWAKKHGILNNQANYSRDAIVWGHGYLPTDSLRFYGQVSYGFYTDIAQPWHVEFGIEYSQLSPTGFEGVSFFATNCPLRQEKKWGPHGYSDRLAMDRRPKRPEGANWCPVLQRTTRETSVFRVQ